MDDPNSRFWLVVERLLILGGGKYEEGSNEYYLPFVFINWGDYDSYEYSLITGTNVNVRDKPNLTHSKIIGQLSYDIVKEDWVKTQETQDQHQLIKKNYMRSYSWEYVCTLDKSLCGFVYWEYVTSPIDYRMGLVKEKGKWMIRFLLAGD